MNAIFIAGITGDMLQRNLAWVLKKNCNFQQSKLNKTFQITRYRVCSELVKRFSHSMYRLFIIEVYRCQFLSRKILSWKRSIWSSKQYLQNQMIKVSGSTIVGSFRTLSILKTMRRYPSLVSCTALSTHKLLGYENFMWWKLQRNGLSWHWLICTADCAFTRQMETIFRKHEKNVERFTES